MSPSAVALTAQPRCKLRRLEDHPPHLDIKRRSHPASNGPRAEPIPETSDNVLPTRTTYAGDDQANETIASEGTRTRWENDRLGRLVKLIENAEGELCGASRWLAANGNGSGRPGRSPHTSPRLTVSNPDTDDQVTTWQYGTSATISSLLLKI